MTKPQHFKINSNLVRDSLTRAVEISDRIQESEKILVDMLYEIDKQKFYVRFGYKSLMGFCNHGLRLTKTQSQRVVTNVRRHIPNIQRNEPTSNIGTEKDFRYY